MDAFTQIANAFWGLSTIINEIQNLVYLNPKDENWESWAKVSLLVILLVVSMNF